MCAKKKRHVGVFHDKKILAVRFLNLTCKTIFRHNNETQMGWRYTISGMYKRDRVHAKWVRKRE